MVGVNFKRMQCQFVFACYGFEYVFHANLYCSLIEDFAPLGFHCDGVAFGSQVFYSDSLELFSLNLPCGGVGMRIPFTSVRNETYNVILDVLAWILKQLALGIWPVTRHDGTDFAQGDTHTDQISRKNISLQTPC